MPQIKHCVKPQNVSGKAENSVKSIMEFVIRHSKIANIFIGLCLIAVIVAFDYMALDKGKIDLIVFALIASLFLGFFAYDKIETGLKNEVIIIFNETGINSFNPVFNLLWKEVEGYSIYIGRYKASITFRLTNGRINAHTDISYGDKSTREITKYLAKKLKKYKWNEF